MTIIFTKLIIMHAANGHELLYSSITENRHEWPSPAPRSCHSTRRPNGFCHGRPRTRDHLVRKTVRKVILVLSTLLFSCLKRMVERRRCWCREGHACSFVLSVRWKRKLIYPLSTGFLLSYYKTTTTKETDTKQRRKNLLFYLVLSS